MEKRRGRELLSVDESFLSYGKRMTLTGTIPLSSAVELKPSPRFTPSRIVLPFQAPARSTGPNTISYRCARTG
jgi:hypothetical protein